jgi:hypothetical protein
MPSSDDPDKKVRPCDTAAKLAYEASDKKVAYPDFKIKYEANAVALIKSKQAVDNSISYDAAANNACMTLVTRK